MKRASTVALALLLSSTLLAACSGGGEPGPQASAAEAVDRTADVQAAAGELVTGATETEPGRIEVQTSITDPRGDAGSPEALQAIAVCEATRGLGVKHVSVLEADGTTFAVAGHPTYGEACAEV